MSFINTKTMRVCQNQPSSLFLHHKFSENVISEYSCYKFCGLKNIDGKQYGGAQYNKINYY